MLDLDDHGFPEEIKKLEQEITEETESLHRPRAWTGFRA